MAMNAKSRQEGDRPTTQRSGEWCRSSKTQSGQNETQVHERQEEEEGRRRNGGWRVGAACKSLPSESTKQGRRVMAKAFANRALQKLDCAEARAALLERKPVSRDHTGGEPTARAASRLCRGPRDGVGAPSPAGGEGPGGTRPTPQP